MFLLHNFIVNSRLWSLDRSSAEPSHDDPISVGLRYHYVLHAILGLSALQLYSEDKSDTKRYHQAMSHQDAAIRQARPHLTHTTTQHAEAVFWFSSFTSIFALAEPVRRASEVTMNPVTEILHAFGLARGVRTITKSLPTDTQLGKATAPEHWKDNREELSQDLHDRFPALVDLETFIQPNTYNDEDRDACLTYARQLILFIAVLQSDMSNRRTTHLIMSWPMGLSEVFLEICRRQAPVAMVILAYYGAAMHLRKAVWFFQGWPEILLKQCTGVLNGAKIESTKLLAWPTDVIRSDHETTG